MTLKIKGKDSLANYAYQLPTIERLTQVIERALLHRIDGGIDRTVGGENDYGLGQMFVARPAQQRKPIVGARLVGARAIAFEQRPTSSPTTELPPRRTPWLASFDARPQALDVHSQTPPCISETP